MLDGFQPLRFGADVGLSLRVGLFHDLTTGKPIEILQEPYLNWVRHPLSVTNCRKYSEEYDANVLAQKEEMFGLLSGLTVTGTMTPQEALAVMGNLNNLEGYKDILYKEITI